MPKKKNHTRIYQIAVFIDAGNLWGTYKKLGHLINFSRLKSFLQTKFNGKIFKIFYYEAYPQEGTRKKEEIDKRHKFFTYLKKGLNFEVVKKPLKIIHIISETLKNSEISYYEKGNFDVEITMDVIKNAKYFDIGIFFTGDSDFLPLITHLRNLKVPKKTYVFSTEKCVSKELKTGSDGYFDIKDYAEIHGNKLVSK